MQCRRRRWGLILLWGVLAQPVVAGEPPPISLWLASSPSDELRSSERLELARPSLLPLALSPQAHRRWTGLHLDLTPAVMWASGTDRSNGAVRALVAPLLPTVAATLDVGGESLLVDARLGSPLREEVGAFYPHRKGYAWRIVWPAGSASVRIEGGRGGEFGSYAVAGLQWAHAERPLALGLGVPIRLRNADGEVGVVAQVRLRFP
jgi:hypothetical protein